MGDQADHTEKPGFVPAPIDVDIDGLADFRAMLGRELDANLRPGSAKVIDEYSMGVRFAQRIAGGRIDAARKAYHDVILASTSNLVAYLRTADLLIDAMAAVVANYRGADQASTDAANQLQIAVAHALKARADGATYDQNVETDREDRRAHAGTDHAGNVAAAS